TEFGSQFFENVQCRIVLFSWERSIERDDAGTSCFQAIYKQRIGIAGKGKCANVLECLFVDTNDDDSLIMRTCTTQSKAHIERTLLDIAQKLKASAAVAAKTRVSK